MHPRNNIKILMLALNLTAVFSTFAQQTIMYTQYPFNAAGLNPAASGLKINRKYYFTFGFNRPWANMENSPRQDFFNFSVTIRHPRIVSYWQNAGFYVDNDQGGMYGSIGLYGTYAFHMLLKKKTILSFGAFIGARRFARSLNLFDENDPALASSRTEVISLPDFIPGVRITHKKYFAGFSLRQITINSMHDLKGNRIGSKQSDLKPNLYADYGRFIPLMEQVLLMPSVALNVPLAGIPIVDASAMVYFGNRVGGGLAIRNVSFLSGIFQLRFLGNLTAGFAYSYPINSMRYTAAMNSFELMVGIVPMGMETPSSGAHSVAKCPGLRY